MLNASTVNIAGGRAYVASKNRNGTNGSGINDDGTGNTLSIFDISTNPAVPTFMGSVTDTTKLFGAYGVAVSGNFAYVAAQGCIGGQPCPNGSAGNSFEVVDVSNPAAPTIVASLANPALPAPLTGSDALQSCVFGDGLRPLRLRDGGELEPARRSSTSRLRCRR